MSVAFSLKKLISAFVMPLPLCLIILLLGLLVYRLKARLGGGLIVLALLMLYGFSAPFFSNTLVDSLESRFQKYAGQPVNFVLVMGGAHDSESRRPVSAMLSSISMTRLAEGILIYRSNPGSKLLLSGYEGADEISNAKAASYVAQAFGVPEEDIVLEEGVKDSGEEARFWTSYLKRQLQVNSHIKAAVVSSASHMPRVMGLFEHYMVLAGLPQNAIIPAPTNYRSSKELKRSWKNWVPSARALAVTRAAWHEYLGIVWNSMTL